MPPTLRSVHQPMFFKAPTLTSIKLREEKSERVFPAVAAPPSGTSLFFGFLFRPRIPPNVILDAKLSAKSHRVSQASIIDNVYKPKKLTTFTLATENKRTPRPAVYRVLAADCQAARAIHFPNNKKMLRYTDRANCLTRTRSLAFVFLFFFSFHTLHRDCVIG